MESSVQLAFPASPLGDFNRSQKVNPHFEANDRHVDSQTMIAELALVSIDPNQQQQATARMTELTNIRVGDTACCEFTIGEEQVQAFAALSHDTNPLHLDKTFARERGFERPVAHGMLALSAISRLIGTELPGPGSLWIAQEVQFAAPVLVGDHVKARVTVRSVSPAAQVVVLETEAITTLAEVVVLRGTAKVRVPHISNPANAIRDKT